MFHSYKAACLAMFAANLLLLGGCAATGDLSESRKNQLIQRVADRWDCLAANDYRCAYDYLSPAYRAVFTPEMYVSRYSYGLERRLTGVEVGAYDRDAAVASVTARVMSRPIKFTSSASRALGATPSWIDESWIWREGEWWYIEGK